MSAATPLPATAPGTFPPHPHAFPPYPFPNQFPTPPAGGPAPPMQLPPLPPAAPAAAPMQHPALTPRPDAAPAAPFAGFPFPAGLASGFPGGMISGPCGICIPVEVACNPCNPCAPLAPMPLPAPEPVVPVPCPPEIRYVPGPKEVKIVERAAPPAPEDPKLRLRVEALERELAELRERQVDLQALEEEAAALRTGQLRMRVMAEELQALRGAQARTQGLEEELHRLQAAQQRTLGLEEELAMLRSKLQAQAQQRSTTNVTQTYKVKTFEMAAKLAKMDGTDDGLYNELPIEVEGEGLYIELVRAGRRVAETASASTTSSVTTSQTYKVKTFEMAAKLSKMDGTDDGLYHGRPIEVEGEGLYIELVRAGRRPVESTSSAGSQRVGSTTRHETYKVKTFDMAGRLAKLDGSDDGLYNGIPIEVEGLGLYRDLVLSGYTPN